jgi:alcohol dehydrogenase class IV
VIRFNAAADSVRRERRLQRMAHAMGLGNCSDDGTELAAAVQALNRRLNLPSGLAALGVTEADFERVIDGALNDHCHKLNPREATREDYRELLRQSMVAES